jgi:hypothetical protein
MWYTFKFEISEPHCLLCIMASVASKTGPGRAVGEGVFEVGDLVDECRYACWFKEQNCTEGSIIETEP